jgi:TetR/AcrR family transcriptional regulator
MTSKERILAAAVQVFAKKGRHGAKMEEIAAAAQINKAMIYYLFASKDNLYLEVIKMIIVKMNALMNDCVMIESSSGLRPDQILASSIEREFDAFSAHPDYTKIILEAMSSNADEIRIAMKSQHDGCIKKPKELIIKIIKDGIEQGIFREIDPEQLLGSIFGMNMVFYMTKPLYEVLEIEIGDEAEYLVKRKKSIIDLVMNGIMLKK